MTAAARVARCCAALATLVAVGTITAGAALAAAGAARAAPPASIGPDRTAWYDASYPRPTVVPPPQPPGIGSHDLVVSGVTVSTSLLPVTPPTGPLTRTRATAVSALQFTIPAGATPASLTLPLAAVPTTAKVTGKLPIGVAPQACPARPGFAAGGRQPWSALPSYDCSRRTSVGHLSTDGTAVVFSDIGAVARGKVLAFVVRPGTLGVDRLVFSPPGPHALSLLSFDSAPTYDASGDEVSPPVPTGRHGGGGAAAVDAPPAAGTPPAAPAARSATATAQPPAVASPEASRPAATPVAHLDPVDDSRARAALLAGLVVIVQGALLLAGADGGGGGRWMPLLVAARTGAALPARPPQQWGVGRFRAPRPGPPPPV